MAETFKIGPSFLLVNNGDPTVTGNWVQTFTQDVEINSENVVALRQGAFVPAELMQGVSLPSRPTASVQIVDMQLALLKEFFIGGAVTSSGSLDSVALPDTLGFLAASDFPHVAVIPLSEATGTNDENAATGFWLPRAYIQGPTGFGWTRPEDGSDPARRYNLSVMGVIDEAIVSTARAGFWGPPIAHGLAWVLPALNTAEIG